jgi:hypothetical protein
MLKPAATPKQSCTLPSELHVALVELRWLTGVGGRVIGRAPFEGGRAVVGDQNDPLSVAQDAHPDETLDPVGETIPSLLQPDSCWCRGSVLWITLGQAVMRPDGKVGLRSQQRVRDYLEYRIDSTNWQNLVGLSTLTSLFF